MYAVTKNAEFLQRNEKIWEMRKHKYDEVNIDGQKITDMGFTSSRNVIRGT